ETKTVRLFSRLNRAIGRPESIFSAFLLWGVFVQFRSPRDQIALNSLLLFWAIFIILNVPSIAQTIGDYFSSDTGTALCAGLVTGIQTPRVADAVLSPDLPESLVGRNAVLSIDGHKIAEAVLFEDQVVRGERLGRLGLTCFEP